jgi:hypothetical protein
VRSAGFKTLAGLDVSVGSGGRRRRAARLQNRGEVAQAQGWEQRLGRMMTGRMTDTFEGMILQVRGGG